MEPSELRKLVESLSDEQARLVKILLKTRTSDVIAQAPLEIVAAITSLLDSESYRACLAVSTIWRHRLLSDIIIEGFIRTSFPSIYYSRIGVPGTIQDQALRALQQTARRNCGRYKSVLETHFTMHNPHFHTADTPEIQPEFAYATIHTEIYPDVNCRYANGKLAWSGDLTFIVVENLMDSTRRHFFSPRGAMISIFLTIQALGDRLLVGNADRHLIAWDHGADPGNPRVKRLPSAPRRCETEGLVVAAILDSQAVLIWDIETNKLSELPMQTILTDLQEDVHKSNIASLWTHLGIIIHPDFAKNKTISLVSARRSSPEGANRGASFYLYEVCDGAYIQRSWRFFSTNDGKSRFRVGIDRLALKICKSDSFGRYQVGFSSLDIDRRGYLFEYNIFSSTLRAIEINPHFDPSSCLLWNGRLCHTEPHHLDDYLEDATAANRQKVQLRDHSAVSCANDNAYCRRILPVGQPRSFGKHDSQLSRFESSEEAQQIFGDDKFLVRPYYSGKLAIWNFG